MVRRLFDFGKRFRRRDFLKIFLPLAATLALATLGSALLLSSLYMRQAMRILEENQAERLRASINIFTRIHFGSVPAFRAAMEEEPIRNYLFGRDRNIERPLRGLERIDNAMLGNEYIDSLYLYNSDLGPLSTRAGWEGGTETSDPGFSALLANVNAIGLSRYLPRKVVFRGESEPRTLFTIIFGSMPPLGTGIRYALVANLSERAIRSAMSVDSGSSSSLYILDDAGKFLSHPEIAQFAESSVGNPLFDAIRARGERSGSLIGRGLDGKRYIAWWADQRELRWRFVSLSPENVVFAPIKRVRNTVVVVSLLVLFSSIIAAFFLSYRMSLGRSRMEEVLAYLRGEADADELRASRLFPSLRFPVAVAMLRVDRDPEPAYGAAVPFDFPDRLFSALGGLTSGVFEQVRVSEDTFAVLVGGDASSSIANLRAAAESARASTGLRVGGFVASEARRFERLPEAFMELRAAFRFDFLRSSGEIRAVDSLPSFLPHSASPGLDLSRLEKAFRLSDAEEAIRQVESLTVFLRQAADPDLYRYAVSVLGSRIPELLGADAETFLLGGSDGFRDSLTACERLGDARALLSSVARRLGDRGAIHAERRQRELIEKVKNIIESRLSDRSLGTAAIAAEVGLSQSYLRDLFKKSEGIALIEYLGKARLSCAKRLLSESSDSVRSVCDQAGFINYSYFFTYFKKMTGCTPSEYRDGERRRD